MSSGSGVFAIVKRALVSFGNANSMPSYGRERRDVAQALHSLHFRCRDQHPQTPRTERDPSLVELGEGRGGLRRRREGHTRAPGAARHRVTDDRDHARQRGDRNRDRDREPPAHLLRQLGFDRAASSGRLCGHSSVEPEGVGHADRSCGTSRRSTGNVPARTSAQNCSTASRRVELERRVLADELRRAVFGTGEPERGRATRAPARRSAGRRRSRSSGRAPTR